MTDWSVSRKLDEVIEQNKEIINLMKMQMVMLNPDVDFYELNNKVRMAVHEAQAKELVDREEYAVKRKQYLAEREQEKQEREKRIREEKLKEKNDEINSIIDKHNETFSSTPWMPNYGEND